MGKIQKGTIASISGNTARVVPLEAGAKPTAKITIPENLRGILSKGTEVVYVEFADFTGLLVGRADGEVSCSCSEGGGSEDSGGENSGGGNSGGSEDSGGENSGSDGAGGGSGSTVPIMTKEVAGIAKVGENLKIDEEGRLSVDTTNSVGPDNTKPITSAAVDTVVGNIEVLLETI